MEEKILLTHQWYLQKSFVQFCRIVDIKRAVYGT